MPASRDTRKRKSPYTEDRKIPGAFEGETVTRRGFMTTAAMAAGGVASAAFGLPALGFALGPQFEDRSPDKWQDVGAEDRFNPVSYVPVVMDIAPDIGEAGKTTVYIRRYDPSRDKPSPSDRGKDPQPYVAISNRCVHLGCPVRYFSSSQRFVCPCHGGVYEFQGKVVGGPPVRPLDRFFTRVKGGRVQVGQRFSLNSQLERFKPRDPSNHTDGLWKYLYPARPST